MKIVPAILEKNFNEVEKKLIRVDELVSWVQIDVTDGEMVEGKTFELELLTKTNERFDNFLYDIHLMVKEPENWINKCVYVNASRIIGHVEMMSDREQFIKKTKDEGLEAGLAFDIDTEIGDIPQDTDVVLLMGRKAGFGNIELDERIYKKIQDARFKIQEEDKKCKIAVDGGVNKNNFAKLAKAGVDIAYCTGAIFNGDPETNINDLERYVNP